MQVIIKKRYSNSSNEYKGYPIFTPQMRKSAQAWAGKDGIEIEIPDVISDFQVFDFDDRMNNKIFKIKRQFGDYYVSFDLYCDALLEVMLHGCIEKGIIKSELTFISGGKLVLKDGDMYNKYQEEQAKVSAPKIKKFEVGHAYKVQSPTESDCFIYLGKGSKHYFLKGGFEKITYISETPWVDLRAQKSMTLRIDCGEFPLSVKELNELLELRLFYYRVQANKTNFPWIEKEYQKEIDNIETYFKEVLCLSV